MLPSRGSLLVFAFLAACGEKIDPVQEYDLAGFQDFASLGDSASGGISYQLLRPVLENRCFKCHSSAVQGAAREGAPVGVDYDTYAKAKTHGPSGHAWVQGGGMPPGSPMPIQEKALYHAWIDAGMPEFGTVSPDNDVAGQDLNTGSDVPITGKTTYWALRPTLELHCMECHASTVGGLARQGAPRGVDYDTYMDAVKYASSGNAWVQDGGMPPAAPLSPDGKALFQSWIDSGVPEGKPADAEATR